MNLRELTDDQRRQTVDARQIYEAWLHRSQLTQHRYAGSMRWLTRGGHDYLHRKVAKRERSLGRRSVETEQAYRSFTDGRAAVRAELRSLTEQLDRLAPVLRAMGLGRVPRLSARILRKLHEHELLGRHLILVGTHALYGYEAAAGVHVPSPLLATGDVDLLWDTRQGLSLLLPEARRAGVLGLLQKVDRSFRLRGPKDFRAGNSEGFWVDLIRPEDRAFLQPNPRDARGEGPDDLHGAAIAGLQWLVNAPRFEAVALGEDGYPVRILTVDPRYFALHKLWVAEQAGRDPVKIPRDRQQAQIAAHIAQRWLGLSMAGLDLARLPAPLRSQTAHLQPIAPTTPPKDPELPDW